ncbi:hypothetical protein, partial [Zeaxanthinibacter enoshimensis]|uniref:hypothetical protein n=1 Tax=Zeaxanthinibacter enoshimensis TaxID=392009 RepID=UPI00356580AB
EPKDWDMGRHYTQKAIADIEILLTALDICSSENTGTPEQKPVTQKSDDELAQQLAIRDQAEKSLDSMERSIEDISGLLGCESALEVFQKRTSRSLEELESESVEETLNFYKNLLQRLQKESASSLSRCTPSP